MVNTTQLGITACIAALASTFLLASPPVSARDVFLTEDMPFVDIRYGTRQVRIERIQDTKHKLIGSFAKTSRKCPPFCIHTMKVAPGVETVGEVELIDFLLTRVKAGNGLLVDARTRSWYGKGTIPGAVNVPFTVFGAKQDDPGLVEALRLFGAKRGPRDGEWRFDRAKDLLLFCNGPWCDQSPRAIKALMRLGYPATKLYYYRGGMQLWQVLGLTTVRGEDWPAMTQRSRWRAPRQGSDAASR